MPTAPDVLRRAFIVAPKAHPPGRPIPGPWYSQEVIKGITFIRPVGSPADFNELVSFFAALGFEPGRGWDEPPQQPGAASRGRPFLAPRQSRRARRRSERPRNELRYRRRALERGYH